jgi:hypothetical protein
VEALVCGVVNVMAGVKMILFSYSNEDTKDEERRKGWVVERRLNGVPSAKPTPCPRTNATTVKKSSAVCQLNATIPHLKGLVIISQPII